MKINALTALSIKKVQLEIQNRPELLIKIFHDCVDVAEIIPLMDGQIGEIDYRSKSGFDMIHIDMILYEALSKFNYKT